jgi:2-amino-4-hydroxy-6-hydroxymethyldihydropteridine diphosphokinase
MSLSAVWHEVYIGLGSNLDDPVAQIKCAVATITELEGVAVLACSPLYSSKPVGPADQPDYINAVLKISTLCSAADLLAKLQSIENQHGRERLIRWGARTLDLDILLFDQEIINTDNLVVPHRELVNRGFVLFPLADIASLDLSIPGIGILANLLANCSADGLSRLAE